MSQKHPYLRPDLINDSVVPVVISAVFDVSGIYGEFGGEPRLLLLKRGEKVAYYKNTWSLPAGVIDNLTLRRQGPCAPAALYQSRMELAGELGLFAEHLLPEGESPAICVAHYERKDPENNKTWDTFLVAERTIHPQECYTNWEHSELRWIPIRELLTKPDDVPAPCTPNLLPDLERLRPLMESFHAQWLEKSLSQ